MTWNQSSLSNCFFCTCYKAYRRAGHTTTGSIMTLDVKAASNHRLNPTFGLTTVNVHPHLRLVGFSRLRRGHAWFLTVNNCFTSSHYGLFLGQRIDPVFIHYQAKKEFDRLVKKKKKEQASTQQVYWRMGSFLFMYLLKIYLIHILSYRWLTMP